MQITGLLNQLQAVEHTGKARRGSSVQGAETFGNTLQQRRINRVKEEIYDQFQISVGTYGKEFSCYIPSEVLYKMSCNAEMREKVYEQLESYSPDNYQASVAGLKPPVKKCTLIFDEGGNATATLEAASDETSSSTANSLYQSYLRRQAAMLPYQMGAYGLNSFYGSYGYPYTVSFNGLSALYKSSSLFSGRWGG